LNEQPNPGWYLQNQGIVEDFDKAFTRTVEQLNFFSDKKSSPRGDTPNYD
jgi:hypothetical protein